MNTKRIKTTTTTLLLASTILFALATMYAIFEFQNIARIKAEGPEDPLEAWSEASYVIWQYNSTFYACRNMSTLLVETLNSNKTYVEQQAIGNLTVAGGTIYLKQVTLNASLTYGANILIIQDYQGQLTFYRNSLKLREIGDCPTGTNGTFTLTSDTTEHIIVELTPTVVTYLYNFWLDLNALTQNCTIRVYSKIDGTNYREIEPMTLSNIDYSLGLVLKEQMISTAWKITIQSTVAEGASRNIPYRYFTEVWG
jgi:hypothetical protein